MSVRLLLLAAAVAAAGCYQVTEQPELAGQDVHLSVLHTSDIHARVLPYYQTPGLIDRGLGLCAELQPFGGAARMAYLMKRERAKASRVMHLDSGDVFQGAPIFNAFRGEVEMKVMGALKPDAVVIGNHEFDLGSQNIATQYELFGKNLFPMLAANYIFHELPPASLPPVQPAPIPMPSELTRTNLAALIKPFEILNLNGLRIAVIGMGNTSSMTGIVQGGNSLGITPLEPLEVLRTHVATLQHRVDLIFVVSHQGLTSRAVLNLAEDQEVITGYEKVVPKNAVQDNWEVLREESNGEVRVHVPGVVGIDAIFGGHLHIVLNPPKVLTDPAGRPVLLVHSGAFAKFFGRADLVVRVPKDGDEAPFGAEIISHRYELFPITRRIPKASRSSVIACPEDGAPTFDVEEGSDNVGLNTQCSNLFNAEEQQRICEVADACRRIGDACTDECRKARADCGSVPAPEDGEMISLLDPYVQTLYQSEDLNKAFAFATQNITRFGLSGEDSPLGNLVADSMRFRNRVEAQFAMTNTLGIRTNMEKGPVTVEEMFNIFPFENTLTTMYLSGTEVQELFDYVTERSSERGCQTQAQISGVSFTMNCAQAIRNLTAPSCQSIADCEATEFANLGTMNPLQCRASRCYKSPSENILINGEALNPTESYKVAVNDFIARGGSGFEVLRRNTTKENTGLSLRDALIDYMRLAPEAGGPGHICGSRAMVEPLPVPTRPLVVFEKEKNPEVTCESRPSGCREATASSPGSGIFVDCKPTEKTVEFYCIPYDFCGPTDTDCNDCEELARFTPVFEKQTRNFDPETRACQRQPTKACPGTVHCCERDVGEGRVEATYYCVVPYCIEPPLTGRITRVVQ